MAGKVNDSLADLLGVRSRQSFWKHTAPDGPNLIVCPLSQRSNQTEPLCLFHLATILTASMGKGTASVIYSISGGRTCGSVSLLVVYSLTWAINSSIDSSQADWQFPVFFFASVLHQRLDLGLVETLPRSWHIIYSHTTFDHCYINLTCPPNQSSNLQLLFYPRHSVWDHAMVPLVDGKPRVSNDNMSRLSEEGMAIFAMMMERLDSIVAELTLKSERLEKVEQENSNLKVRVAKLEDRIDFLDTRDRCNNLIISGGSLSSLREGELIQSVTAFLKEPMQYELSPTKMSSAFQLGSRPRSQSADPRSIMIIFRES